MLQTCCLAPVDCLAAVSVTCQLVPCRRHMASLPGVVQALGLSALLTEQHQGAPNGHAAGEHEGHEERNGATDAESLLQPELYVDLRPFYDRAPVTVR